VTKKYSFFFHTAGLKNAAVQCSGKLMPNVAKGVTQDNCLKTGGQLFFYFSFVIACRMLKKLTSYF
jgi:hypothetical protein